VWKREREGKKLVNLLISASESGEKPPWSESGSGDSFAFLEQIKGNCRRASQSKQVRQGLKRVSTNHTTTTMASHRYCLPLSRRRLDFEPLQVDEDGKRVDRDE
jgi:hypothetical protein